MLDEQPCHLVPQYVESTSADSSGELIWNPRARLCWDGDRPAEFQGREELLSRFDLQGAVVWVEDAVADFWQPFWLGSSLEKLLEQFRPSEPAPQNLSAHTRSVLANAGILVRSDHPAQCRWKWEERVHHAQTCFGRGFAPLAGLIHPYHIAALRRYVRHLVRNRRVHLGDNQSPLRYVEHNDPVLKFFHHQLTPALSDVAGEMLKPSYAYMASYLKGAELPIHTDRLQCEFTISLCLDFAPEPALETPWPLYLDTPEGNIAVYQAIGDALFFRGRHIPHYRKRLELGTTSTSVFFHYVSKGFVGHLD